MVGLGVAFYMLFGKGAADLLVEQLMHREQVITRAGAASIDSFLILAGKSLALLATTNSDQKDLQKFVEEWKGTPIQGVSVVDSRGVVRLIVNQTGSMIGKGLSISDREYFPRVQTAKDGKVVIGKAIISRLGQTQGRFIVPLVSAMVDNNGEFTGALLSSAVIDELTVKYLNPLKMSDKTGIYLLGDDGTVLYSSVGLKTGENVLDYLHKNPFLGSEVLVKKAENELKKGEEGKLNLVWPGPGGWQRYLVAYSPIKLEEGKWWYLVMTTPVEDALVFMGPIYVRIVGIFALVFLGILIYAIQLAKYFAFKEAQKYEHKLHGIKE